MALWNNVSSGFDKDEETINFGARTVTEINNCFYESSTIATIQSNGESVEQQPKIQACVEFSKMCVTIDKSVTVFTDEECGDVLLSVSFESMIDRCCITNDGWFLFVILETGIFYCFSLLDKGRLLYSKPVLQNSNNELESVIKMFIREECNEQNVYFVTSNSSIYKVTTYYSILAKLILKETSDAEFAEIRKKVTCVKLNNKMPKQEIMYAQVDSSSDNFRILMSGKEINIWPGERRSLLYNLPFAFGKSEFLKTNNAILVHGKDNDLSIVCSRTMLGKKIDKVSGKDFVVIQDDVIESPQILFLRDFNTQCQMQLFSFPGLESKFQINVPKNTFLVHCYGCSSENIVYLEGVAVNSDLIESIRIKSLAETDPELRLMRLIQRRRFDEAKDFAEKFSLNTDPIYLAKAAFLVSQFSFTSKEIEVAEFNEFIAVLDKINDVKYVFDCCNNALLNNINQTRKLLLYTKQRLIERIQKANDKLSTDLLSSITNVIRRLETFEIIQKMKGGDWNKNIKEWRHFCESDLLDEFIKLLYLGELEAAGLIWVQHLSGIASKLPSKFSEILNAIPEKTSLSCLFIWLQNFIPTLLAVQPSATDKVLTWAYKKVLSLESSHHPTWPEVGLIFCNQFLELLHFKESGVNSYLEEQYGVENSPLHQFVALIQHLTDLDQLKKYHRVIIPLEKYMRKPCDVAVYLLNQTYADKIPDLITKFLSQYMLNHSLQHDQVLTLYIEKTLRNSKNWWSWGKAPWEEKIACLLMHIHNVQNRLQLTLEVLKKAPIPWSPTMAALAEKNFESDNDIALKIRAECNSVPVKLILKKYGFERVGDCNTLVSKIVKEDQKNMVEDIHELTKNNRALRRRAYISCIGKYLMRGEIDKAMQIVDTLDDKLARSCCNMISEFVSANLQFSKVDSAPDYSEILDFAKRKLEKIISKSEECSAANYDDSYISIDFTKAVCNLKAEHKFNITHDQYFLQSKDLLRHYIRDLSEKLEDESLSIAAANREAQAVGKLLGLPKLMITTLLFQQTKNYNLLKLFSQSDIKRSHSWKGKDLLSILLHKISFHTFLAKHDQIPEMASMLRNISAAALCECSYDDLYSILFISLCSNVIRKLSWQRNENRANYINQTKKLQWTLYMRFMDTDLLFSENILTVFKLLFQMYAICEGSNADNQLVQISSEQSTPSNVVDLLTGISNAVKKMQSESSHYALYQTLKAVHFTCCAWIKSNESFEINSTHSLLSKNVQSLLRKICGRSFDLQLGLVCLFILPETFAPKWFATILDSVNMDYFVHTVVSELSYEYYRVVRNDVQLFDSNYKRIRHHWASKLSHYGISYKDMLSINIESKNEILQRLMCYKGTRVVHLLEEFCRSFGIDTDKCFLMYLEKILTKWNPKLETITTAGVTKLNMNKGEIQALQKLCKEISLKIKETNVFREHILSVEKRINFYHYEIFLIILELLGDQMEEKRGHFHFLQHYTRVGKPTEIEREQWLQHYSENCSLPAIAEWRLPFLPTVDKWKIITPELNLRTYEKWLNIAPILNLKTDLICTFAIKGSVTQSWIRRDITDASKWVLYPKNTAILKEIKKCLSRMNGPKALEYGTAILYFVINHTPQGADQVAVAQECFAQSQLWTAKELNCDEGLIQKIMQKYHRLTSMHILYTHGLGETKYLNLITNPDMLIRELYSDESIPKRYRSALQHRPNVNDAVNYLGQLFKLNVMKLRLELLQIWLQPPSRENSINESVTENLAYGTTDSDDSKTTDDNLLRACYMLKCTDSKKLASVLIAIGFERDKDADTGPGVRHRALQVLQTIMDVETMHKHTLQSVEDIRLYMKTLPYLSELENWGLAYNISDFQNSPKMKLVENLFKTLFYSHRALSLIIRICIDFNIYDYKIWNQTLNQMVKLLMVKELNNILPSVVTIGHIVNCDGYISAWQFVISEPFRKLDFHPSPVQIQDCLSSLRLLNVCPVVEELNISKVIQYSLKAQQLHFAAAFLPFLKENEKSTLLQKLRNSERIGEIIMKVEGLSQKGLLTGSYIQQVLKEL